MLPFLQFIILEEDHHCSLFFIIKDESQTEAIVQATRAVIGELDQENTGLLFVVPVSQVHGLGKMSKEKNA